MIVSKAQFQMLDSFVKEYELKTESKLSASMDIKVDGEIKFKIVNIKEENQNLIGEIELENDINLIVEETIKAKIKIVMGGLFKYDNITQKNEFERMLKINGATTLSNFIRTYIYTNTSLSGMPGIITPMVNFIKVFEEENEKK